MQTIGYLLIIIGLFILRQVTKGRGIQDLPKDMGDLLRGVVESVGDVKAGGDTVRDVLSRTGDTLTEPAAGRDTSDPTTGLAGAINAVNPGARVLDKMKSLGTVNKYVLGAVGPNAYDCSGLVWAAMKSIRFYTGARFTTFNFLSAMGSKVVKVSSPIVGDVVLWHSHIGVMDSPTTMYSALNPSSGIRSAPLSWGPKGESYAFYRLQGEV